MPLQLSDLLGSSVKNVFQPMNSRKTIDTKYTYHNFKVCWKSFDVFDVMQSWWDRQTLVDFHVARDHIAHGENSSLKDSIDGWWLMTVTNDSVCILASNKNAILTN